MTWWEVFFDLFHPPGGQGKEVMFPVEKSNGVKKLTNKKTLTKENL
jgi:hypothetical protein